MRAINANTVPSNDVTCYLDERSGWSKMDRSYIKRNDRRKQRHALRAELPSVVLSNLEAERLADHDHRREADLDGWGFADIARDLGFGFIKDSSPRTTAESIQMFPAPIRTHRIQVVTVIRKRANHRRVVEQLRIAA